MRGMLRVILNECEGSIPVVRRSVRRYSKHSKGSAAIMRKTLNVILNGGEGSVIIGRDADKITSAIWKSWNILHAVRK